MDVDTAARTADARAPEAELYLDFRDLLREKRDLYARLREVKAMIAVHLERIRESGERGV